MISTLDHLHSCQLIYRPNSNACSSSIKPYSPGIRLSSPMRVYVHSGPPHSHIVWGLVGGNTRRDLPREVCVEMPFQDKTSRGLLGPRKIFSLFFNVLVVPFSQNLYCQYYFYCECNICSCLVHPCLFLFIPSFRKLGCKYTRNHLFLSVSMECLRLTMHASIPTFPRPLYNFRA